MGFVPPNHKQWTSVIAKHCPELDTEVVTYLANVAIDEPSTKQAASLLIEAFQDYDAARDEIQAQDLCQLIFNELDIQPVNSSVNLAFILISFRRATMWKMRTRKTLVMRPLDQLRNYRSAKKLSAVRALTICGIPALSFGAHPIKMSLFGLIDSIKK